MKIKALLVTILLLTGYSFGQTQYPLVTPQMINAFTDSTGADTATAWWPSPLAGDTVRVRASVLVAPIINPNKDRRTIFYYGYAYGCWVQDVNGAPWSGFEVYQADTSDFAKGTGFDLVDTASTYEFTGVVTPYGQATELALITAPVPIPVNLISQDGVRPKPYSLTIDSCWKNGVFNLSLRKYEGMYCEFDTDATHLLITSDLITGTGSTAGGFYINDTSGHKISVYAQSKYYRTGANYTLRPSYTAPPNQSRLPYVRGILQGYLPTSGPYTNQWVWEIVPMYPGDLGEPTSSPPAITNLRRDISIVPINTPVNVTCQVVGLIGAKVTSVQLYSSVNGIANPVVPMTLIAPNDSVYTAVIPAVTTGDSNYVEYYVKATDNDNLSSTSPANLATSKFSYFVFSDNRQLTIQYVRYSPLGSGYSPYNGYQVTVSGIVTADTSNIPGGGTDPTRVYIQNGTTPWSGIILGYAGPVGTNVSILKQGDSVTVSGTVVLSSSTGTRLDTITALTVISHNNPLPAAHVMSTNDVGVSGLGTVSAEQWNSCIVTYQGVTIDSANVISGTVYYGESYGKDSLGTVETRINWADGRTQFWTGPTNVLVKKGDKFGSITGILGFAFSNYKLTPRNEADIQGYVPYNPNGIKGENVIPNVYKLSQNYPNPFNPSTIISYDLPKSGLVTLKIYNILGQQVKTLVNESQSAGTHQVMFNASRLTSGVYFYSISAGNFTQVKKMMLIK